MYPAGEQVADTLHFLHAEANLIHSGLCPAAVLLTGGGAWKLASLAHTSQAPPPPPLPCGGKHSHTLPIRVYRSAENHRRCRETFCVAQYACCHRSCATQWQQSCRRLAF